MSREAADNVTLVAQALLGPAQFNAQLGQVGAAAVPQLDALEIVPDALICVQIRRVPRQPLQMQPLGRSSRQVVLDRLSLVDRRPIPDHQHLAVDLAQEHPQESDDPLRVEGGLLDLHHQASVECDATDGREMIMRQLDREHGRLAFGRPGAFRMRQQIEARLIYPDDGVSFLDCLFLMAGQRSSRH